MKEKKKELFPHYWYRDSSLLRNVYIFIGDELDSILPSSYNAAIFREKKERIYQRVLQRASENRMYA